MRTPADTVFPLAPPSARFRLWLWLLTGVLPVVVAGGLFAYLAIEGNLSWTTALIGFVATVLPLFLIGVTISRQAGRHRLVLGTARNWQRDNATAAGPRKNLLVSRQADRLGLGHSHRMAGLGGAGTVHRGRHRPDYAGPRQQAIRRHGIARGGAARRLFPQGRAPALALGNR